MSVEARTARAAAASDHRTTPTATSLAQWPSSEWWAAASQPHRSGRPAKIQCAGGISKLANCTRCCGSTNSAVDQRADLPIENIWCDEAQKRHGSAGNRHSRSAKQSPTSAHDVRRARQRARTRQHARIGRQQIQQIGDRQTCRQNRRTPARLPPTAHRRTEESAPARGLEHLVHLCRRIDQRHDERDQHV